MSSISVPALELANRSLKFTILSGGLYKGDPNWTRKGVCDPYNRLYLVLKGNGFCQKETGERHRIKPGFATLLPTGSTWDYECDQGFEKFWIHFRLEPWPGHDLFENVQAFQERAISKDLVKRLMNLTDKGSLGLILATEAELRGVVASFINMEARQLEQDLRTARAYAPIFEAADAGRFTGLRLGEVAKGMNKTLSALSHAFRRDTGVTITRYLHDRMLQRARDRLLFTQEKIRVIARELGYEDEFYFSRRFRMEMGVSPQEYRKQHRLW